MMIGFFENVTSERAIAARCADSIAIREFLNYELTEETPDHSSLSIIRQRLEGPVFEEVFKLVLAALQQHGLLRGKNLGIDPKDTAAVRKFDRKRSRKMSNQEW